MPNQSPSSSQLPAEISSFHRSVIDAGSEFSSEFSFQTRVASLKRLQSEEFDLLIVGGGITGAAVARDAASRGLEVALVEMRDFAWGTSSRSSKLIHGGLRYLENREFHLVFEALSERALLLKTSPHLVRPLPFILPVYQGDSHSLSVFDLGLWLYDLLALFRTPGFHKRISKKKLLSLIPSLKEEGLKGGLRYYDASMWDDGLAIDTLRSASGLGASVVNYVQAGDPLWNGDRVSGMMVQDLENPDRPAFPLRAKRTILCTGPWLDEYGKNHFKDWKPWLAPSKGVHLVFDLKKYPLPGAVVMSHPEDGRISFAIPRTDIGEGVLIVGTTDGPTPSDPASAEISPEDITYLLGLLRRYFPGWSFEVQDILSAYVGVRPLMGSSGAQSLQKVSREHFIGEGPGKTVIVAGGKYTTHRKMAEEIVQFALDGWEKSGVSLPVGVSRPQTRTPVNSQALPWVVEETKKRAEYLGIRIPDSLWSRYGAEAVTLAQFEIRHSPQNPNRGAIVTSPVDPQGGFAWLESQFRFALRSGMVLHLEDFYFRRMPLFLGRADHGLPWAEKLVQIWGEELGQSEDSQKKELERLQKEIQKREAWRKPLSFETLSKTL